MLKPTLKDKQAATHKHFAQQFPLFKKGVTGKSLDANPPKKKTGRPKSGRRQLVIWISDEAYTYLHMMRDQGGYSPGVLVEMMISLTQDSACQWVLSKRK
jgi:hypothetical protein